MLPKKDITLPQFQKWIRSKNLPFWKFAELTGEIYFNKAKYDSQLVRAIHSGKWSGWNCKYKRIWLLDMCRKVEKIT